MSQKTPNIEHVEAMSRAVRAVYIERGKSADEASRLIDAMLSPLASDAMKMHYQDGKPYEEVDAWYARAVRERFEKEGFAGVLPSEGKK